MCLECVGVINARRGVIKVILPRNEISERVLVVTGEADTRVAYLLRNRKDIKKIVRWVLMIQTIHLMRSVQTI